MTARPAAEDFDDLPDDMRRAPRWLLWKSIPTDQGRTRKIPHYTSGERRNGALDGPVDAARLAAFDQALAALQAGGFDGLGFALGPDGDACWQGIDLDDIDQHPGLRFIADGLPGYVEVSPSGHGLHAIGRGRYFPALAANTTGIESYAGGRFFTVTGKSAGLGEIEDIADFVEHRLAPLHGQGVVQRERPQPEAPPLSPEDLARLAPELRSALLVLDPDAYAEWIAVGHDLRGLGEVGRRVWEAWAQGSEKFDPRETDARWASFRPDHASYRAVFARAQAAGWVNPRKAPPKVASGDETHAPEFSDEALALEFAERHADRLRWVQAHGRWMTFDGQCWRRKEPCSA